ncbi:hypothetical protein ACX3YG_10770 [Pseudomonas wadenswilerensis]
MDGQRRVPLRQVMATPVLRGAADRHATFSLQLIDQPGIGIGRKHPAPVEHRFTRFEGWGGTEGAGFEILEGKQRRQQPGCDHRVMFFGVLLVRTLFIEGIAWVQKAHPVFTP